MSESLRLVLRLLIAAWGALTGTLALASPPDEE